MKKFLSVMLTLFVVCMSMVVVSADASAATVTAELVEATANADSTFTVKVVLADNPGMVSLRIKVDFDKDVLEFVSLTDAALLSGKVAEAPVADVNAAGSVTLYWSDGLATENNTANGTLATITFKALAETDATAINFELLDAFDCQLAEVGVEVVESLEVAIEAATEAPVTTDPVTEDTTDLVSDTDSDTATDTASDTDTNTDSDTATDTASDTTGAADDDKTPATGDGILFVSLASVIALAAGCVVYSKKRHN